MSQKIIDNFEEFKEICAVLMEHNRVDLLNSYSSVFAKTFTLLCASYFESEITQILQKFIGKYSQHDAVKELLVNKTLKRQYHTLFDWDSDKMEHFFKLFGDSFRDTVKERLKNDDEMNRAITSFMRIGRYRNQITHQNILLYTYDKTPKDVLDLFTEASKVLVFFKEVFEINEN